MVSDEYPEEELGFWLIRSEGGKQRHPVVNRRALRLDRVYLASFRPAAFGHIQVAAPKHRLGPIELSPA